MQFNQSMASLLTIMGFITQPIDTIIDWASAHAFSDWNFGF
jgi:hypothetical protein